MELYPGEKEEGWTSISDFKLNGLESFFCVLVLICNLSLVYLSLLVSLSFWFSFLTAGLVSFFS